MKRSVLVTLVCVLSVALVALVAVMLLVPGPRDPSLRETTGSTQPSQSAATEPSSEPTEPPTEPTEPPIVKVSTATVSTIGDMLMHAPVFNAGYNSTTGAYDMSAIFRYLTPYSSAADMALGNLETTLAGNTNGYEYKGYPNFNCPDSVIEAMKNAGFDTILTANNHTYDTGSLGFQRTQEIIGQAGLRWIGTKPSPEAPDYLIADINDIQVGLLCYTYATPNDYTDRYSLNYGAAMTVEESLCINAFRYDSLPVFYGEVQENLQQMEALGVEATMLFIHWGEEYHLEPMDYQKQMAQQLCNLGIDVIVGGHPHVVEPVELLTSQEDENQKTVCIYSVGNAVSNQRLGNISYVHTAHTEDGAMFSVTFAKYSDGTVIVETADVLPLWVDLRYTADWKREYCILPLDQNLTDWKTSFAMTDDALAAAKASYDRTWALVGEGITQAKAYYAANQAAVEAQLGVQK